MPWPSYGSSTSVWMSAISPRRGGRSRSRPARRRRHLVAFSAGLSCTVAATAEVPRDHNGHYLPVPRPGGRLRHGRHHLVVLDHHAPVHRARPRDRRRRRHRDRQAGGIVTAIDVAESSHDRLVVDVTCSASDADHAEKLVDRGRRGRRRRGPQGQRPDLPAAHRRQDRGPSKVPLRNRDDLSMAYTPGVGRVSMALAEQPRGRLAADHQGQLGRGGHRRLGGARARQHRARRGAAGDGGQGRAVQAVRRHRRLADLPGHPGHRRDRAGGRDDRARLRRHQPRGHRGAALLRDRAPAAREPRHPGLPRRPARYGDRGAGRADQRAARACTRSSPPSGSWWPAAAPPAPRSSPCCSPAASPTSWSVDRAGCAVAPTTTSLSAAHTRAGRGHQPAPGAAATCRPVLVGRRRLHRRQRARACSSRSGSRTWPTTRWSSRSPTPTRRSTRPRRRSTPRWWPAAARTTRTRSTTCWPSPASSAACSTPAPREVTIDMLLRAAEAIAHVVKDEELNPNFIIPTRLPPRRAEGGRRRDQRQGAARLRRQLDQGVRTRSTSSSSTPEVEPPLLVEGHQAGHPARRPAAARSSRRCSARSSSPASTS